MFIRERIGALATHGPGKPFSQTPSYVSFDLQKERIGHIILPHEEQQKYQFSIMRLQLRGTVFISLFSRGKHTLDLVLPESHKYWLILRISEAG